MYKISLFVTRYGLFVSAKNAKLEIPKSKVKIFNFIPYTSNSFFLKKEFVYI